MPHLICPICRSPLARTERALACANRHSFDIAKEGYINLLPVQQKKSLQPGDNLVMVQARRNFLEAGHYGPLREAVVEQLRRKKPNSLLDIGCGEGWYTQGMASVVDNVTGLDIAKPAVRIAAKKHPAITWLVAGAAQLPVANASVDAVSSLFSPLPIAEMARVLKPSGLVLVVRPAADHLWAMREALFGEVKEHRPEKFLPELESSFILEDQFENRFPLHLDAVALKDLLAMTPYVWKAKRERREALEARAGLDTEAVFRVMGLAMRPV
ncbi:Ribosomal RNA large subunit methyltransferase A [gamma proteobacterium HdN1]|nr:Ribosomal RNA large subunit methyltransferase A [gamma proteobacterium HdN1]